MRTLVVRGLCKRYPREQNFWRALRRPFQRELREALCDVDLRLTAGRIYGLIGPNGAGKTTLLKLLGGLVEASSGSIQLDGVEYAKNGARLRQRVRMVVADERSFYWRLSLAENLRFFATLEGLHGQGREQRVAQCLDAVGLSRRAQDSFRALSTGMRQRLAIARGLLADPELLLLDEATRSLDPEAAADVRSLMRSFSQSDHGRVVVWASHDLHEIEELCTDAIALRDGRLVECSALATAEHPCSWRIGLRKVLPAEAGLDLQLLSEEVAAGTGVTYLIQDAQTLTRVLEVTHRHALGLLSLEPMRSDLRRHFGTTPQEVAQ